MKAHEIDAVWSGPPQCESCGIRHLVLFADLERKDFEHIHQPIAELELPSGEYLYKQGDPPRFVFTLRKGLIKLVSYHQDGRHRIVRLLKTGDLAGMEALNGQSLEHYAVVIEPVSACRIPVETIENLNKQTPRLYRTLTARWQRALHEANVWLTEFSTGPAKTRVASLLLYLSSTDNTDKLFYLPNREDIGSLLAIATETASRVIADFRRQGIVKVDRFNPQNAWADISALRNLAGK